MNRFVIVDSLPYLLADGKTHTVRWDDSGFTVGAEVELASVPAVTYSEISVKAKCAACLDSIGGGEAPDILSGMTVKELKEFAASNGIDLGEAKKKDDVLAVIRAANESGGETEENGESGGETE